MNRNVTVNKISWNSVYDLYLLTYTYLQILGENEQK